MLNQLPLIVSSSGPASPVRPDLRPTQSESRPMLQQAIQPPAVGNPAGEPVGAKLERIVEQAARDLFPGREVAVQSFYDKDSGRYVHRIADGESGELLLQTPPDELLRFFASGREPYGQPLLEIDA
jgi:uncharacterized FlaG/YvyC family protein